MAALLPAELLDRVLGWLPVVDLVAARSVCRRWRAAVAQLRARDVRFVFGCGPRDLLRSAPWLQRERAFLATTPLARRRMRTDAQVHDALVADLEDALNEVGVALPCTCGIPALLVGADRLAEMLATPNAHTTYMRPARWELLVPERARAIHVAALVLDLGRHVNVLEMSEAGDGLTGQWLPAWFYLPSDVRRPSSPAGVNLLVTELLSRSSSAQAANLWAQLADPATAHSVYADAEAAHPGTLAAAAHTAGITRNWTTRTDDDEIGPPIAWEDPALWKDASFPQGQRGPNVDGYGDLGELYDAQWGTLAVAFEEIWFNHPLFEQASRAVRSADPTLLDSLRLKARQSAASWRICRTLGWMDWLRTDPSRTSFEPVLDRLATNGVSKLVIANDDAVQAFLDAQVAATDRAVAEIKRLLRHATVFVRRDSSGGLRGRGHALGVFGLSPGGHLVGALSSVYGSKFPL